jgi:hypothetical protein
MVFCENFGSGSRAHTRSGGCEGTSFRLPIRVTKSIPSQFQRSVPMVNILSSYPPPDILPAELSSVPLVVLPCQDEIVPSQQSPNEPQSRSSQRTPHSFPNVRCWIFRQRGAFASWHRDVKFFRNILDFCADYCSDPWASESTPK